MILGTPSLVIIILHYGSIADTHACLASLYPDFPSDWRILVIDNGTGTGAATILEAEFPLIQTITLDDNHGWAGGNNVGIAWAQSQHAAAACLLNNDTLAPARALRAMLDALDQFGPCLLHPAIDYGDPSEGAQLDPSQDATYQPLADHPSLYPLNFAYGACLMIPLSVINQIGNFDERFFLQLEETDFFLRARKATIPAFCLTTARIIHFESRSFGARITPKKLYYIFRNSLLLWEKHDRTLTGLAKCLRFFYWRAAKESPSPLRWLISSNHGARAMRAGVFDYCRRRFGAASNLLHF